jgi:hypothetical protein
MEIRFILDRGNAPGLKQRSLYLSEVIAVYIEVLFF